MNKKWMSAFTASILIATAGVLYYWNVSRDGGVSLPNSEMKNLHDALSNRIDGGNGNGGGNTDEDFNKSGGELMETVKSAGDANPGNVSPTEVPLKGQTGSFSEGGQESADPAVIRGALGYESQDLIEDDTETGKAERVAAGDLKSQLLADYTVWSNNPIGHSGQGVYLPEVFSVRLHDPNHTQALYMFQQLGELGSNFAFYSTAGQRFVFGSEDSSGSLQQNQWISLGDHPIFTTPQTNDLGDASALSAQEIAALSAQIRQAKANTSGQAILKLEYATPINASGLAGDALALFNQWGNNAVGRLAPPAGDPPDTNKPQLFLTTLRIGADARPIIYMLQSKVTSPFAPDWTNFAFFAASGQLIDFGSDKSGFQWGQYVDANAQ